MVILLPKVEKQKEQKLNSVHARTIYMEVLKPT